MNYDQIFEAYYSLYRAEAQIPNSSEDEYIIGIPLASEAISRWSNYDNTMWRELFTTLIDADDGDKTVSSAAVYACPEDMKIPGGAVVIRGDDGKKIKRFKVIQANEAQFKTDESSYAYFTGDPNNGFTLHLNPDPEPAIIGGTIDYVYYKKPLLFDRTNTTEFVEMSDPYFIVHRMLANRFRSSRNPYYGSAKQDAEDALRMMQLTNNSGSWDDPWTLPDNSGTSWGA